MVMATWLWRAVALVILGAAFLIAESIALLDSEGLAESAVALAARITKEHAGLELSVAQLRPKIFPPGLEAHGVEVRSTTTTNAGEPAAAVVTLRHARLEVALWQLLRGRVDIGGVVLEGLRGVIDAQALERFDLPKHESVSDSSGGRDGSRLGIDLQRGLLLDAAIEIRHGDTTLELADFEIELVGADDTGPSINVVVRDGRVQAGEQIREFTGRAIGEIVGSLADLRGARIERLRLRSGDVAGSGSGEIIKDNGWRVDATVDLAADLSEPDLLPATANLSRGLLKARANLNGHLSHIRWSFAGNLSRLGVANRDIGDLSFAVASNPDNPNEVMVNKAQLATPRAGVAQIHGSIGLSPPWRFNANVTAKNTSIEEILRLSGVPGAWVRLPFGGKLSGTGQLSPLLIDAQADLLLPDFEALSGPYDLSRSYKVFGLGKTAISGVLQLGEGAVTINTARIETGESIVNVTGPIHFDAEKGMRLEATSDTLVLRDLGTIGGAQLSGQAAVSAEIVGPYAELMVAGEAQVGALGVLGVEIGECRSGIVYQGDELRFNKSVLHGQAGGELKADWALGFADDETTVTGAYRFENLRVAELLARLPIESPKITDELQISGRANGQGEIFGTLGAPNGAIRIQGVGLRVAGVAVGATYANLLFDVGALAPIQSLSLNVYPDGRAGDAEFKTLVEMVTANIDMRAHWRGIDLARYLSPWSDVSINGDVGGWAQLTGTSWDSLAGELTAESNALETGGIDLGRAQLDGNLASGKLSVQGTMRGGDIRVDGAVDLRESFAFAVTGAFEDLDLSTITRVSDEVGVVVSGSMFIQGAATDMPRLLADLNLSDAKVGWRHFELRNTKPVLLGFSGGTLTVDQARFQGHGVELSIIGRADGVSNLKLRLRAEAPLLALSSYLPGIAIDAGELQLGALVHGRVNAPQFEGALRLVDGALTPPARWAALNDINAELVFHGRRADLTKATAAFANGDGHLELGGGVRLGATSGESAALELTARLRGVRVSPSSELEAAFSGDLGIAGTPAEIDVTGVVEIDELVYSPRTNLKDLLDGDTTTTGSAIGSDNSMPTKGRAISLGIRVHADDRVFVANDVLQAELRGDLRVTGSPTSPGLLGTITPINAAISWGGHNYSVSRALIDFADETRVAPQFDIEAHTEACGMKLTAEASGTLSDYSLRLEGVDDRGEVDPQDALVCAQFGLRLKDYSGLSQTVGLRDTLPGAVDALWMVSGMDDKIKRLLPVVDEFRLTSGYSRSSKRVEPRLLVAKELGQRWQLRYNGPLSETDEEHLLRLQYQIGRNAALESSWASVSDVTIGDLGLDLTLVWEFQ